MMVRGKTENEQEDEEFLYDFFISYALADEEWVRGYLIYALENEGKTCLTTADFHLGQYKIANIQDAVLRSQRTLLILSPEYLYDLDSDEGRLREFATFLASHYSAANGFWSVIPVKRREVELPPHLKFLEGLDCSDEQRSSISLKKLLGKFQPKSPEKRPQCPYPGLAVYREENNQQFFGRTELVETLVQKLNIHSFLTIVGTSGGGKSSLVYAGLIPALRQNKLFGEGQWSIISIRPGDSPLSALNSVEENIRPSPETPLSRLLITANAKRFLLFIDQLEELFTHKIGQTERDEFINLLIHLTKSPHLYTVLAIREDFFRMLMSTKLRPLIEEEQEGCLYRKHYYDLPPVGKTELTEIIREPALQVGIYVDQMLVERMINDAGNEPGILPFIQETMVYLWNFLELHYLPVSAYEKLQYQQMEAEPVKGLKAAIALHAEHVFAKLDRQQQAIAQRIFIRLLEFVEGRTEMRRQQSVASLRGDETPQHFDDTLEYLATQRLLTLSSKEGEDRRVDIAHESLIQAWPTYQTWIKIWGDAEKQRRSLENKYSEWIRLKRKGGLLDKAQLEQAKQWENSLQATGMKPDSKLTEYINSSKQAIQWMLMVKILTPVITIAILMMAYYAENEWRNFYNLHIISKENPQKEVPNGTYMIGQNDNPSEENYPIRQFTITTTFYMDSYEVTNYWYCLCYQANGCTDFRFNGQDICADSKSEQYKPITYITLSLANEYCIWIGGRLPSAEEWEIAARGKEAYIYPTGNEKPKPEIVNTGEKSNDKTLWTVQNMKNDMTPSGIYGLTGNASEWTGSYSSEEVDNAIIKGGNAFSWDRIQASEVFLQQVNTGDELIGFRCITN